MFLAPSTVQPNADAAFFLDRLRLRFVARSVERQFRHESIAESIGIIRTYLAAAAALYLAFGILDVITEDPALAELLFIRCAIVCPILLGGIAFTFHPSFPRFSQPILCVTMLTPGLGIVVMTAIMQDPFNNLYYAGLIMVVMYGSCLVRLHYFYAVLMTTALLAAYQLSALYLNPIQIKFYLSNNFFLVMASAVGLFSGYLQELYVRKSWVAQKTIESKNQQTQVLLVEAQKASKSKSDFLANMSHELRTPLNAIIGFSEFISKELLGPVGTPKYLEYCSDINRSGTHLLSIINDILDLAKAEAGKLQLQEERVDLRECVEEALRTCQPAADNGAVALKFLPVPAIPIACGDRRLILQIVLNLISNAVKFTPSGGRVHVTLLANTQEGITIAVQDTGIGIPAENLERVMRPFEQVETSYARSHGGTGLGLPYSAKLAELHDGAIRLESELQKGTTATLWLPPSRLVDIQPTLRAAS